MSAEASGLASMPRAELVALKAELKRLRREVGRGVAMARIQADPGPGDDFDGGRSRTDTLTVSSRTTSATRTQAKPACLASMMLVSHHALTVNVAEHKPSEVA